MATAVSLEHVSKKFTLRHQKARSFQEAVINYFHHRNGTREEFWALKDIDLEIARGETLGIVGRNGSGKSTVLKLITRILEPTSGRVTVDGKVSALIELGAGFHPDLTGRENIYLNGSILGLSRKDMSRKLDDIVKFAELDRFIDTPVKHYSSGMYARLGFSVAISVDPDILIIDEVLSVGDESFQRKCMDKIREFKEKGITIIFVSHSLDAIKNLCDRAIWLEAGAIKGVAKASRIVDSYLVDANTTGLVWTAEAESGKALKAEGGRNRWGSREVEITRVRLLDGNGRDRQWFLPKERFVVRMEYHAREVVPSPVFGIAIHGEDGTHITGPNTATSGYDIQRVDGDGRVDYVIEDLPLVPGSYDLSVAVYDCTRTHAFDHHHRLYRFEVRRGAVGEDLGLVRIPCVWEHVPYQDAEGETHSEPVALDR